MDIDTVEQNESSVQCWTEFKNRSEVQMKRLLIVALLLLCAVPVVKADQPTPDASFEKATLTDFTMVGVGTWACTYNVLVNHAPPGAVCQARSGRWAVVNTNFITLTMGWSDLGLADAVPGSVACLYWYCYNIEGMPFGVDEVGVISPYTLYLPIVVRALEESSAREQQ